MIDNLRHRLQRLRTKTYSVVQRAEIARAIVVPKVTLVARHAWPEPTTVRLLQSAVGDFVWGYYN